MAQNKMKNLLEMFRHYMQTCDEKVEVIEGEIHVYFTKKNNNARYFSIIKNVEYTKMSFIDAIIENAIPA